MQKRLRAYNKRSGKTYECERAGIIQVQKGLEVEHLYFPLMFKMDTPPEHYEVKEGDDIMDAVSVNDIVLLEWTGHYDKNGDPIFEGDIVEYPSGNKQIIQRGWNCGCCGDIYGFTGLIASTDNRMEDDRVIDCVIVSNYPVGAKTDE